MAVQGLLNSILPSLQLLVITTPLSSPWASFVLWLVRLLTFSIILRTYIVPLCVHLLFQHFRVRSVSLRSIRGVHFRQGYKTWHIDRIGLSYHRPSGAVVSRLTIKVQGLKLEIAKCSDGFERSLARPNVHRRMPTLADFAPSPMAYRLRVVISAMYAGVEPYFRPLVRSCFIFALRLLIRCLPALTQILDLEVDSALLELAELPGVPISLNEMFISSKVVFTQVEKVTFTEVLQTRPLHKKHSRFLSMIDWRARLTSNVKRTWARAWGKTRGTASISVKFRELSAVSSVSHGATKIFRLPCSEFNASVNINSSRGIEPHSFDAMVDLSSISVSVGLLQSIVTTLKKRKSEVDVPFSGDEDDFFSTPISFVKSPVSPTVPFMTTFSNTSIPFRVGSQVSPQRPKVSRAFSFLSSIKTIRFHVSDVELEFGENGDETESHKLNLRQIFVSTGLSDGDSNAMHRNIIGRSTNMDELDQDVYMADFSMGQLTLERTHNGIPIDSIAIATVGEVDLHVLVTQWPGLWMASSSFMSGDPNAALLAFRLKVGRVDITGDWDSIQNTLLRSRPRSPRAAVSLTVFPSIISPIPRISVELEVGQIRANLPFSGLGNQVAVEMKTNGLTFSVSSYFSPNPHKLQVNDAQAPPLPYDTLSVRMRTMIIFSTEPLEIGIRINPCPRDGMSLSPSGGITVPLESAFEPVVIIDAVELTGSGTTLASVLEDNIVSLDVSSTFVDLHCVADALSVELWHPEVMSAVSTLVNIISQKPRVPNPPQDINQLKQIPLGFRVTIALDRFTIFVTSPDINPREEMDISRGIAFHSGVSLEYCSILPFHFASVGDLSLRAQNRHKLYLPEERIMDAISRVPHTQQLHPTSDLVRLSLWDTGLRSAVATAFVADDPYSMEELTFAEQNREFLSIPRTRIDLNYPGIRAGEPTGFIWESFVDIPNIRFKLELVHTYSLLLAAQTLKSFSTSRGPPNTARVTTNRALSLSTSLRITVHTFELLFKFPTNQFICTRINNFHLRLSPDQRTNVHWETWFFWVPRPRRKDEDSSDEFKWEECVCLRDWNMYLENSTRSISVAVKADTGRIRIPHQFILSELMLSIALTLKCIRHLVRLVPAAKFFEMDVPGAEGPKDVPHISVEVQHLIAEAADDPFESRLAVISHAGFRASEIMRTHRDAFDAKVAAIRAAESPMNESELVDESGGYRFSSRHSVTIEEARERLLYVHSRTWREVHRAYHHQREQAQLPNSRAHGDPAQSTLITVTPIPCGPPLFRLFIEDLKLTMGGPSFPLENLPDFLYEQGAGQPRDTEYFLIIPFNISLSMTSLQADLRDYPLPLISIHATPDQEGSAIAFDSDLVVAEEVGTPDSVEWWNCVVLDKDFGIAGANSFSFGVPKTIMPVKTFANPVIRVTTQDVTDICWGISYGPAIQDVMRVVETLSSAPRDQSPPPGFWDKLRLVFHWKILASFKGDVHFHMKGSRDPYNVLHDGAGFALCWSGNPKILIGQQNKDGEQIQVISDVMSVTIPNFEKLHEASEPSVSEFDSYSHKGEKNTFTQSRFCELRKSCAKLVSGVRFGVRFDLERTCGSECNHCSEPAHRRECRYFAFQPHYNVKLERKTNTPAEKADSYNGFRTDFIHMSISLTSAVRRTQDHDQSAFSSFHLTPKAFAQFWHWWGLFDSRLSLPIRQGSYYRHKLVSPKFGRHLATIKYRISIPHLFISHVYLDESRQAWSDGITRFVGVKALIGHFHADMHQRDQESTQFNPLLGTTEVVRHKPFNAVEVVLRGLDLRAMLATFADPVKRIILPEPCPGTSKDRIRSNLPVLDPHSIWIDKDDFIEVDWCSTDTPKVNLLRTADCPHFTYFKRTVQPDCSDIHQRTEYSKFGNEDTHICLLGKESSGSQIQVGLVSARIEELRKSLTTASEVGGIRKMINLLDDYVVHLQDSDAPDAANYYMATDTVSPSEWSSYDNVYQVHCPKLFMNESVRDILMQYYYCSGARRGFEYHLATRAVKFIRDQDLLRDQATLADDSTDDHQPHKGPTGVAQAAVQALLKSLNRECEQDVVTNTLSDGYNDAPSPALDPLEGWSHGVSLERSHFCVLLKPQLVLQSETNANSVCIVAAGLAKLHTNAIMDDSNVDDPVSGKIMSRTYTTLHGLQTYSPSQGSLSADGCVPIEVLIDFRCESSDFDRLVPQTEATIRYDKFNRLRLRNNVTSVIAHTDFSRDNAHLQHHTDLLNIHVPQFTVSATDGHFAAISDIVTKLLLFSDAAHKTRLDKLETLLFSYDFTDFASSANVVSDLQARLREAVEQEQTVRWRLRRLAPSEDQAMLEIAKLKADVLALADELSYVFEAIKLAQDRIDGNSDQKSALLLLASSPEISWRMLDSQRDLLAKLSVKNAKFSWLSRQDSSTVNNLRVGDLHAFDGSVNATWSEILCKHNEPSSHPLVKRDLFAVSNWTVLAPVGGIAIYENFDVSLHPMRLQLDTKVGQRIMEYIWPARKHRRNVENSKSDLPDKNYSVLNVTSSSSKPNSIHKSRRPSLELISCKSRKSLDSDLLSPGPLRRLGTSRSFTDLRSAILDNSTPMFHKNRSTDALSSPAIRTDSTATPTRKGAGYLSVGLRGTHDAVEMKTRSSQKTFVAVDIASLHLFLSVMKEDAFLCRDARINTRDLHYRNQVWSLEELVDQFIPSDPSWKGWVKMAFQQPFFEVFPVARELLSKTKRIASKGTQQLEVNARQAKSLVKSHTPEDGSDEPRTRKVSRSSRTPLVYRPEPTNGADLTKVSKEEHHTIGQHSRPRVRSLFRRSAHHSRMNTGSESTIGPSET